MKTPIILRKKNIMNECKHHHFIPKCYLSYFSDDGKGVWVYNKTENRAYLTSIDKIFQKKNWYRIPKELIPVHGKDLINPLSIETEFFADQIESQFNHYLKSISSTIDELLKDKSIFQNCRLHEDYVNEFAIQIAIQFFRYPVGIVEIYRLMAVDGIAEHVFKNVEHP